MVIQVFDESLELLLMVAPSERILFFTRKIAGKKPERTHQEESVIP
jgi:hypothetical protein